MTLLRGLRPRTVWRWLALGGGAFVLIWALLPWVVNRIFGIGSAVAAPVGVAMMVWSVCPPVFAGARGWRRWLLVGARALLAAVALAVVVMTALMVYAASAAPREGATVIVLGSQIHGDRPSRLLKQRLDVAATYLVDNPDANCVVTGGLGPGETYTEAYVMKKYLVEQRGIDPARIACEQAATDTRENLQFSMHIIREKGWSEDVSIATQVFHQYRSRCQAYAAGATHVGGTACVTPFHFTLNYWVRECAAIARLWLTGQ